jgi:broad specificity phosphatase PhoE
MGTLYLVRHGQASFGSHDYDRLSELGQRQCKRLGEYFAERGKRFDAVLRGSLKRHQQSLAALREGFGEAPAEVVFPALNEYDSEGLIRSVYDGPLDAPTSPEQYRHHFRLLRLGLARWIAGDTTPPAGMPSFAAFCQGIDEALQHAQRSEGDVLLVSSGGPISTAVSRVLGAPAEAMIDLNLRVRNSAITEFSISPKRLMLHSFNHLPHLDAPQWADWVTYT